MRLADSTRRAREEYAGAVSSALGLDPIAVAASMDQELARLRAKCDTTSDARWYASLAEGSPDFSIYETTDYIYQAWPGTVLFTRPTLRYVVKHVPAERVGFVVDLGCGIGYTTSVLAREYPDAATYGTNVEGSQAKVCRLLARHHGWSLVPDVRDVPADPSSTLVVAAEYFEHFHRPVEHLEAVLSALGTPRWFAVANAFGARSAGHFPEYAHRSSRLAPRAMSRLFGDTMRAAGYVRAGSGWNGRPTLWLRP